MNKNALWIIAAFALVALIDTKWELIEGLELGTKANNLIKLAGSFITLILIAKFGTKTRYELKE